MRIGGAHTEIHIRDIRMIAHRDTNSLEWQYPERRSFAVIQLRDRGARTHADVTCGAPEYVHPLVSILPNAAVTEWITAGLNRLVDLTLGAQTSVAINGEDSSVLTQAGVAKHIMSTGLMRSLRPDRVIRQVSGLVTFGFTLAGGYAAATGHSPRRTALIDDRGHSTFGEIHARTQALAGALAHLGIGPGDTVGLLARNNTEMVEIITAVGKLGADCMLLTTGVSAERIATIAEMHRLAMVFADPDLEGLISLLPPELPCFTTSGASARLNRASVSDQIDSGRTKFDRAQHPGRLIVLTSGTTGAPKTSLRPHPRGFSTIAAFLSRLPFEMDETMLIPTPLSNSWGLAALRLSLTIRATVVLTERFDARECLRLIAEHRVRTLIAFPIMLQRILDLPAEIRDRYDTSSLRLVVSGSGPLAEATVLRFVDTFGEILYSIYGSVEVSWATIAEPSDLRVSPTTAGRPPLGTKIAVLDEDSKILPLGATGRIFVGHKMLFDGYIDVPAPPEVDGMLDTGDFGYLDATGRLFLTGRGEELIVSGEESIFPRPIEEALSHLPQISEVAVVGIPDRDLGQRPAAFIVPRAGSAPDPDLIRAHIRHRVGRFSVPRDIVFLGSLPRNAAGNVLKRLLRPASRYSA